MRDRLRNWYQERRGQLLLRLKPALAPAMAWYRQRDEREQRALLWLAIATAMVLVYLLFWRPVANGYQDARERYAHHQGFLLWAESHADLIRGQQNDTGARPASSRGGNWINLINSSASREGLSLQGFTPEGDDAVRVSLEQQSFAAAIGWLQSLESEHGIRVATIEVTAGQESGTVNIRATLRRTG